MAALSCCAHLLSLFALIVPVDRAAVRSSLPMSLLSTLSPEEIRVLAAPALLPRPNHGRCRRMIVSESSVRDTLAVLRRVQLFRGLDDEHLQQIADASKFRESQPNEVLARRGEIGQEMFVIVDGTARVE